MNETTLVLVCKRPAPGMGKQRLAAKLGPEKAYQVADALLACALEDAVEWPGPVVIAPASAADAGWAKLVAAPMAPRAVVVPQAAGNLGERLNTLDRSLRARGMAQLVFIGSDAPGLAAADYAAVHDALQQADTVLKPAADGGVVLMASRCTWPDLTELPWSSNQLGVALRTLCQAAGQTVAMLAQGYDVDDWQDLIKLTGLLAQDQRPARRTLFRLVSGITASVPADHA